MGPLAGLSAKAAEGLKTMEKKFIAKARNTHQKLAGWYLELPADAHDQLGLPPNSRVLVKLGGEVLHRALRSSKNGYAYIGLNGQLVKRHRLLEDGDVPVSLSADNSEFGMDFPEEMQEVLAQDPEGNELFMALKPGEKRGYLHYISSVKASQAKINRALHIMRRLRERREAGEL